MPNFTRRMRSSLHTRSASRVVFGRNVAHTTKGARCGLLRCLNVGCPRHVVAPFGVQAGSEWRARAKRSSGSQNLDRSRVTVSKHIAVCVEGPFVSCGGMQVLKDVRAL